MLGRGGRCPGALSVGRSSRHGCVLSDGRFAVLGGMGNSVWTSSCEALTLGSDEHWSSLPPMHDSRDGQSVLIFSNVAVVARCIIVVRGYPPRTKSALAYIFDDALGRWLRVSRDLPRDGGLYDMSMHASVDDREGHLRVGSLHSAWQRSV
jgi:hypothetical protein